MKRAIKIGLIVGVLWVLILSGVMIGNAQDSEDLNVEVNYTGGYSLQNSNTNGTIDLSLSGVNDIDINNDNSVLHINNESSISQYQINNINSKDFAYETSREPVNSGDIRDVCWDNSGNTLLVINENNLVQYSASNQYDITTLSYVDQYDFSFTINQNSGFDCDDNHIVLANTNDKNYHFTYDGNNVNTLNQESSGSPYGNDNYIGITVNENGKTMQTLDTEERIDEWEVTPSYDVSGETTMFNYNSLGSTISGASGLDWDNNGQYMFVITSDGRLLQIENNNIEESLVGNIKIRVDNYMPLNSEQDYTVIFKSGDYSKDITNNATTTIDESIISMSGNTLNAHNTSTDGVNLSAQYTFTYNNEDYDYSANETIIVTPQTIEYITKMSPEQWVPAVLGMGEGGSFGLGSEMQWILLAIIFGATAGGVSRNEWVGNGVIIALITLFWVMDNVTLGIMLVSWTYGIFIMALIREIPSRTVIRKGGGGGGQQPPPNQFQ